MLGALFLGLFVTACKHEPHQTKMSDQPAGRAVDEVSKPIVGFGVISRYNPRIMFQEYQPIVDYLTEHTPYRFELRLGRSYEDAVAFLCKGKVQVASLGGLTYLEAHRRCGAVPVVKPLNAQGQAFYRSVVVVRKDSPIRSLADLPGHSFAFASMHSTSGNLVPRGYLKRAGIELQALRRYANLKHHDAVAKAVLAGDFDAGAVKDIIGERYLSKGLRIIYRSQPIPSVPIVVRPDCDPNLVAAVKAALLEIDASDPGQAASMADWNAEFRHGFVPAKDSDYDVLRKLARSVRWKESLTAERR